jgi:hypothetical protein
VRDTETVWERGWNRVPSNFKNCFFFVLKIIIFYVFRSFWYIDLKNDFLKNKNIILMHF